MRKSILVVIGIAALAAAYWWLTQDGRLTPRAPYALDAQRLRALADALPGPKPTAVRYEKVSSFVFPHNMVVAGDDWGSTAIPAYAYQLAYPDHTAMIDAAMDRTLAKPDFMIQSFDDAAYARVEHALLQAQLIVITHEHMDHIGGIAHHAQLASLLPALKLTDVQLAHPEAMKPAALPAGLMSAYQPIHYQGAVAIAPGMVLIAAPGHTPGSQMVYVKLADGKELLFLGDVVWHARNIEVQRERPRWITAVVGEDRAAVSAEIAALHALSERAPEVRQVPGHDGEVIDSLTRAGYLQAGFQS